MKLYVKGGGEVVLSQADFVAQGGEGRIYAQGDTAYKVYLDPARTLPLAKIGELRAIADPNVIRPERVLLDHKGVPLGYTMRYVAGTFVLAQLLTRSFRERHGIGPEAMAALVLRAREGLEAIHRAGALVVDLSEMNLLVGRRFDAVYFIDVDSFATPHFPATALTPGVRDPDASTFSPGSDWFSFAVVSFQMFTGIHPYKGRHPTVKGLEERMRLRLTVLDPSVGVPAGCYPLDVVPEAWRGWYRAVLERGERLPPPSDVAAPVVVRASAPLGRAERLTLTTLATFDAAVLGVWEDGDTRVVSTDGGVFVGARRAHDGRVRAVGFSPRLGRPVAFDEAGGLHDLTSGALIPLGIQVDDVMSTGGRLIVRCRDALYELVLSELGRAGALLAATRKVASVLPRATRLFDGVAVQDLLGAKYVSVFPRTGSCHQLRIPELEGVELVDARYDRGVLMARVARGSRYDRLVVRFDDTGTGYDVRCDEDVGLADLDFVVLDSGVCVHRLEEGRLELFPARPGRTERRTLMDPLLDGDVSLLRIGGGLGLRRGRTVYQMGMTERVSGA